jgi:hypothetical protein
MYWDGVETELELAAEYYRDSRQAGQWKRKGERVTCDRNCDARWEVL